MRAEFGSHDKVAEILFREDRRAGCGLLVADDAVDDAPDLHLIGRNDELVEALAVEEQLEAVLLLGGRQGIRRTALLCGERTVAITERATNPVKNDSHAHMIRPRQAQG